MIGIDLRCATYAGVVVARCAFAERYSPAVCRVMSSRTPAWSRASPGGDC